MNTTTDRLTPITLILLFSLNMFGCMGVNQLTSPTGEVLPMDTPIPTPTRYIISVDIATDTPEASTNAGHQNHNQEPLIDFEDIPSGVYLLYEDWSSDSAIYGINLQTGEQVYVSNKWYAFDDQRNRIAYLNEDRNLEIYNLQTKDSNEIPLNYRCSDMTWFPDDSFIAINCEDRVYVISIDDLALHLLTTWTHPSVHSYWNPTWSPDGKWIATTFRQLSSLNTTEDDGIYLLDTSCIKQPSTCEEKMVGPIFPYSHHVRFAWSPKSDYIAAYVDYSIKIADIKTSDTESLVDNTYDVYELVWSPDGKWIYYSQATERTKIDIYKVSIHGGEPILIAENKGVVFSILDLD